MRCIGRPPRVTITTVPSSWSAATRPPSAEIATTRLFERAMLDARHLGGTSATFDAPALPSTAKAGVLVWPESPATCAPLAGGRPTTHSTQSMIDAARTRVLVP